MSETTAPKESVEWFLYIIETDRNTLYTGITTSVARRFQEHEATHNGQPGAKGAKFFRTRKPVKVVYQEICRDRAEASRREYAVKALSRSQKLRLINSG